MKKLLFVATAALCATVFGAIESTNVVGYDTAALRDGGKAVGLGASFVNVDNSDLTLGDVKVVGYTDEYADAQIIAKKLNGYGVGGTEYYWYDVVDGTTKYFGWYNNDGSICYNEEPLPAGEGLWIYSQSADFKLQSSGKVPTEPIEVTLRDGGKAKLVANPMPIQLTLGQVTVSDGTTNGYADAQIIAKKLNGYGVGGTEYFWYDTVDGTDVYYGWYNNDGSVNYNDVTLNPGEALWIYSQSSAYKVKFPAPAL